MSQGGQAISLSRGGGFKTFCPGPVIRQVGKDTRGNGILDLQGQLLDLRKGLLK